MDLHTLGWSDAFVVDSQKSVGRVIGVYKGVYKAVSQ